MAENEPAAGLEWEVDVSKILCLALVPVFGLWAILVCLARESTYGDPRQYAEVSLEGTIEQLELFDGSWWVDGYSSDYRSRPDIRIDSAKRRAQFLQHPSWVLQRVWVEGDRLWISACHPEWCIEPSWEFVGRDEAAADPERGIVGGCGNGFFLQRANRLERIWRRGKALLEDVREGDLMLSYWVLSL